MCLGAGSKGTPSPVRRSQETAVGTVDGQFMQQVPLRTVKARGQFSGDICQDQLVQDFVH